MTDFQVTFSAPIPPPPRITKRQKNYDLLMKFIDNGWCVRHFNSHEVTLERCEDE